MQRGKGLGLAIRWVTLVVAVAIGGSCGRTQGGGGGVPTLRSVAGETAGHGTSAGSGGKGQPSEDPPLERGGAPGERPIEKPTRYAGDCTETDRPGTPCTKDTCWSARCGVRFSLTCLDGVWVLGDDSPALELVCSPDEEFVSSLGDLDSGACCAERLPREELGNAHSCSLCPPQEPRDGQACSLADDCSPKLIDCFYRCCCYGTTSWAQCDGQTWHVASNCSSP